MYYVYWKTIRRVALIYILTFVFMQIIYGHFFIKASAEPSLKKLTLMVYMCGSDLESENGAATEDYNEIKEAINDEHYNSERINIVLMTGGAANWENRNLQSKIGNTVIRAPEPGEPYKSVWEDASLNMGEPGTLSFFLDYCVKNYPAQEYILILWCFAKMHRLTCCLYT